MGTRIYHGNYGSSTVHVECPYCEARNTASADEITALRAKVAELERTRVIDSAAIKRLLAELKKTEKERDLWKLAAEFNAAPDDAEFEAPHPIFKLAEVCDQLREQVRPRSVKDEPPAEDELVLTRTKRGYPILVYGLLITDPRNSSLSGYWWPLPQVENDDADTE